LKDLTNAEGLADKPSKLLVKRTAPVRLVISLMSFHSAAENTCACELAQLSLNGAGTVTDLLNYLMLVESLVRVQEQGLEHPLPRSAEERRHLLIPIIGFIIPIMGIKALLIRLW